MPRRLCESLTCYEARRWGFVVSKMSFGELERVAPVASRFRAPSGRFDYRFPALSLTVLRWRVAEKK